jgi:hypothetical protein
MAGCTLSNKEALGRYLHGAQAAAISRNCRSSWHRHRQADAENA